MGFKYKLELSHNSIQGLISQLKKYVQSLEYKCDLFARRLAEEGVNIAKAQIVSMDAVFTTDLYNSIKYEKKGTGIYFVIAGTDHCAFVEFGTGIVGQTNPYPGELPLGVTWNYASGRTIHYLPDGRYGWFYFLDGKWYFTEGMPSRPFMFNTSIELQQAESMVRIAKEVFSNDK